MKFRSVILALVLLVTACSQSTPVVPTAGPTATRTLPPPTVRTIAAPDVESAVNAFLGAWQAENYQGMYDLLTSVSQDAFAPEKFIQRYSDVAVAMTLDKLDYEILATTKYPTRAQVSYRVNFHLKMLGDLTREMQMDLSLDNGAWKVQWDDSLILPELKGGNTLVLDTKSPTRGNIYDRSGNAVAAASDIMALGLVKGEVNEDSAGTLYSELAKLTSRTAESIRALYDNDNIYQGDYIPVGETTRDAFMARYDILSAYSGLRYNDYSGRFYFDDGIAPHVTGYVGAIQAGDKDEYLRQGFKIDDRVGMSGLEKWGENSLLGQRGATLYVVDPNGITVSQLARVDSKPSQSIYMTIDSDLQLQAQQAISGFSGALVVLERDTGRVLAMVSSPGFDPNAFEFLSFNSYQQTDKIYNDGLSRLYNRATGDGYPLGSVFKIITMATALETGAFTPESTYDCGHFFTEIPGVTLKDWTYDKGYDPSGLLTLPEGLMRSCNPWFYKIGMELYRQGKGTEISKMARAFGLGSPTGIDQVAEAAGNIPEPSDEAEAARIAIGQNTVLVNPLQVARFIAAVGNGGTLYRPQVVEKIADPDGNASYTFKPEAQGTLPVKPENLKVIQDAMRSVVANKRGTAVQVFSGLSVPVYGKTGTAETSLGISHAWFAGYTDAGREDKPDIAFAVIAEFAGEGSEIAAPIARRLVEIYFLGRPQKVYPWEARFNVTRTPAPEVSETPQAPGVSNPGTDNGSGQPAVDPGINERTATPSP
jgi:penicillin-binding protein 2